MKYPIIAICCAIALCSCKTTKTTSDINVRSGVRSDISLLKEAVKISTKNHAYFAKEVQSVVIEEDITVTEYDKDGKKTKETNAKRKIIQDSDKATAKEETKGIAEVVNDSTHHIADISNMVDTSVKEESIGGQESFGKWLGIILGIAIVGYVIYLCIRKKLRLKMFG